MLRKKDSDTFKDYLQDNSGLHAGFAEEIVFPETELEAVAYFKEAAEKKTPVTISGAGTGIVGGRIPFGGTILSTDRLNKILDIRKNNDKPGGTAVIEPGVSIEQLCVCVAQCGLTYLPDPTEKNAFLGGTVATNASGAKGFKYGSTRKHILGLHVILPTGQLLDIRRGIYTIKDKLNIPVQSRAPISCSLPSYSLPQVKNAAGYHVFPGGDLIDLFIGCEGTLGFVSQMEVALAELPQENFTGLVFFESRIQALEFVFMLKKRSYLSRNQRKNNDIDAACIEYFDEYSLDILRQKYRQIHTQEKAAVYFSQDVFGDSSIKIMEKYAAFIDSTGIKDKQIWFSESPRDKELINAMRYDLPVLINEKVNRNGFSKISTDIALSDKHFPAMFDFYERRLKDSVIPYCVFGHIGENHLHVNLMPQSKIDFKEAKNLYLEFIQEAVHLGGTVSAEHGIGKLKREYLKIMLGVRGMREMAIVKKTIDPDLILNQETIFETKFLKQL